MSDTIVIAAGGTGGHLFPAQTLASDLEKALNCTVIFMAKGLSRNPRFDRARFRFFDITASHIGLRACIDIPRGVFQSIRYFLKTRPKVVVGFGSFHTFPVLVAARLLGIPVILHEANRKPGRVNRIIAPFAAFSAVFFPDTKLSGKVVQADIPLRIDTSVDKTQARSHYGLELDKTTILVFGGSQGAKMLNSITGDTLARVGMKRSIQVLHFTGNPETTRTLRTLYENAGIKHVVKEFENQMQYAWKAADLVLARAGASTIAEQIACSVPAIFIPFPYATDRHQDHNAAYVEQIVRGAKVFFEDEVTVEKLANEIETVLEHKLQSFINNIQAYKESTKNASFAEQIITYLGVK